MNRVKKKNYPLQRLFLNVKERVIGYKLYKLVISLACLIWIIIRTGKKPSRFAYPCQKIAATQVISFTYYLFPLIGIKRGNRISIIRMSYVSYIKSFFIILIIFYMLGLVSLAFNEVNKIKRVNAFYNHCLHEAIGFFKTNEDSNVVNSTFNQRIVSVYNSFATNWDYRSGMHWEYINQDVVNSMVSEGIMTLTGESNLVDAWSALIPYQQGEAVAIKVNFNNAWNYDDADNDHDAFPETVNAVIDGLVSIGVPVDKIWITDPSRVIPDRFRDKITHDGVLYYSAVSTGNRPNINITTYVDTNSIHTSPIQNPPTEVVRPAQVLVDADHLINIPLMKGHPPSWVTLGLKNHYGSVLFKDHERNELHSYIYPPTADPNTNPLGDINNNPHIRDKTRLVLGDALFGQPLRNWSTPPIKWQIFDDNSPNLLFFGVDPIAAESVMLDYLNAELELIDVPRNHDYLHYAANLGLGIHEHWDSFTSKKYNTIDYIEIIMNDTITSADNPFKKLPEEFLIAQNYPNPFNDQTMVKFFVPKAGRVTINVYNLLGRNICELTDEYRDVGIYGVYWNGKDEKGENAGSGIYYYQIISNNYKKTKKMILLR